MSSRYRLTNSYDDSGVVDTVDDESVYLMEDVVKMLNGKQKKIEELEKKLEKAVGCIEIVKLYMDADGSEGPDMVYDALKELGEI